MKNINHKNIGIGVVGCGRMGRLRSSISTSHPAVDYIAISDRVSKNAENLGLDIKADKISTNNMDIVENDNVHAVIVSTSEPEHCEPAVRALELGKPVLVEKPIALTLKDADRMINAAIKGGTTLHVGYTLRFNRHYLIGKQQILEDKIGNIISCTGRFYNSKATGLEIIKRSKEASFIQDALTYLVDLFGWYLEGNYPVEVIARSHGTIYRKLGHDADEITSAIITYSDGTIVNLSLGYCLPSNYPSHGRLIRAELIGEKGVLFFDDDRKEHIGFSEDGMHHAYVGQDTEMAFLTSNASGNWALGKYWGPFGEETRSWLDFLSTGIDCPNTTAIQARKNLEVTLAIEEAAKTKKIINLIK
jgi:predicted dehydrogenase